MKFEKLIKKCEKCLEKRPEELEICEFNYLQKEISGLLRESPARKMRRVLYRYKFALKEMKAKYYNDILAKYEAESEEEYLADFGAPEDPTGELFSRLQEENFEKLYISADDLTGGYERNKSKIVNIRKYIEYLQEEYGRFDIDFDSCGKDEFRDFDIMKYMKRGN